MVGFFRRKNAEEVADPLKAMAPYSDSLGCFSLDVVCFALEKVS